jgi:hypothetical protein
MAKDSVVMKKLYCRRKVYLAHTSFQNYFNFTKIMPKSKVTIRRGGESKTLSWYQLYPDLNLSSSVLIAHFRPMKNFLQFIFYHVGLSPSNFFLFL